MILPTPRLILREFQPDDVEPILAYQSEPAYLEHNGRTPPTRDQVVAFVELMVAWRDAVPRTRFQLVITLDGRLIGTCGVRGEHPDATEAEYGCELAPAAWGHGFAEEASRPLLDFGFRELGLERIIAVTQPGNMPAVRLAETLGFTCVDGRCTLRRSDWEPTKP